ncbi:MAG TPA: glycogen-binding domain-containing protein [Verrucomicrobiae bacterium]|jgi:1,4-alpha-glucan branching enzyme|nr:glycogen-binding domain-containing protein [Verrucomicrobiae bacterium]
MAKKTSAKSGVIQKSEVTQIDGSERAQGFSFRAPEAISVQLVGDFTHWQEKPISLKKEDGGLWRASVPLTPGEHHYRFLVDGEWRDDPECRMRVPNPFGGQNMMRKVA